MGNCIHKILYINNKDDKNINNYENKSIEIQRESIPRPSLVIPNEDFY